MITSVSDLSRIVRERRLALRIPQGDLADAAGIDQANLSRIERGSAEGKVETYLRLFAALGLSVKVEPKT